MTVPVTTSRMPPYIAGSGQTTFAYTFQVYAHTDICVYKNGAQLTLGTHYTVTGVGSPGGGNVVLTTGATAGDIILLMCILPLSQLTDLQTFNPFPAATVETTFDRAVKIDQQLQEQLNRALMLRPYTLQGAKALADPLPGAFVRWSPDGTTLENALNNPVQTDVLTYQANMVGAVSRPISAKLGDIIHAADFGFTPGNSTAGNTAAWNALMAAIPVDGATVHIGPGAHHHNGLTINRSDLRCIGQGHPEATNATRLICADAATHSVTINDGFRLCFENLWIGHSGASNSNTYAIRANGFSGLSLTRVSTWVFLSQGGSWGGVYLGASATTDSFFADVDNCRFMSHAGHGLVCEGSSGSRRVGDVHIRETFINSNATTGILIGRFTYGIYPRQNAYITRNSRGIDIVGQNPGEIFDIHIGPGAILDDNDHEQIRGTFAHSVRILHSWIGAGGATSGASDAWGIRNLAADTERWQILGNYIAANVGGGVEFAGKQAQISGNMFWDNDGGHCGIVLTPVSSDIHVDGNKFKDQTTAITDLGTGNLIGFNMFDASSRVRAPSGAAFGDSDYFATITGGDPALVFAPSDFFSYSRLANTLAFVIGGTRVFALDTDATAGTTRFWLYDTSAGTLKRVKLDNSDLGSGVKKYLYVDP